MVFLKIIIELGIFYHICTPKIKLDDNYENFVQNVDDNGFFIPNVEKKEYQDRRSPLRSLLIESRLKLCRYSL